MIKNAAIFGIFLFLGYACTKPESKVPLLNGEWIGDTVQLVSDVVPESVNWEDALLQMYGTTANFNNDSTFVFSTYTDSLADITSGKWYMADNKKLIIYTDTLFNVASCDTFEFNINKLTADSLIVQALLDSLKVEAVFRKVGK